MSDSDNGQEKNLYTIRYGNSDGEMKCGHVTGDNEISAFLIRSGFFHNHYISLDGTGERHRAGGTTCRSPGAFQVRAGDNCGKEDQTILMSAKNGDILISAPHGKIILDAQNILLRAQGQGGPSGTGFIDIEANEKINIKGRGDGVDIQGNSSVTIKSDNVVDVIGQTTMNIYGGIIDMADGNATSLTSKPGKTGVKAVTVLDNFGIVNAVSGLVGFDQNLESKMSAFQKLFQ